MARIKLVYLGGGSTRAAGTMASLIANGADFEGSEVVLVDLDEDRLALIRTLAQKMARARGHDIVVTATTDRRAALADCDAVLSSFRPGGFEARVRDERIPLDHGLIGQETQGAGGFFMALRAVAVLKDVCAEMEELCPDAWIFNYTNPVNIVAEAITRHSPVKVVSLCEGPIYFAHEIADTAGLDPERLRVTMVGLNHGCWGVEHDYDGRDPLPLLEEAWERRRDDPTLEPRRRRQLQLAVAMGSVPADYFEYYYFTDDVLAELRAKPTTRAEDILGWSGDYWRHYEEQAQRDDPQLDPARSRGGIHELELAIDVMDADLQRQGRGPSGQHAERRRRASRLPGRPRRRGARSLHPRRDRGPARQAATASCPGSRGDARRVPGPRRGDGVGRHAGRRHPSAQREPARPSARRRRACLRRPRLRASHPPARPTPPDGGVSGLLLGVDGGNTKTVAVVVDRSGAVLGAGGADCGDIHNAASPEPALVEIVRATIAALDAAGATPADLGAAAFSLAGADWPEDFERLRRELTVRLELRDEPEIVNDAIGGLRCGSDELVGVSVVIGTYAAVAGRSGDGKVFHLGFWPEKTGAFALGSLALAAVWRHMLGLGPDTSLLPRALERWDCADAQGLLYAFTRIGGLDESERGRFADAVLDEAETGDGVAISIVETVAARMGDYARVCAERTGQLGAPFPLVLCGGVLRHPSALLRDVVRSRVPDGRPVYPDVDPVAGAVLIAADRVGARPDLGELRSWLSSALGGRA